MIIKIIIPTFNRKKLLVKLLNQIYNQSIKDFKFDIVVVDDGSTDGTSLMLSNKFPDVQTVRGTGNWWYTQSINEGLKYIQNSSADFVLLLNDDIEIESNYLFEITRAAILNPKSIIGSISFSIEKPHLLIFSGVKKIIWWRAKFVEYYKPFTISEPSDFNGLKFTKILPGRGMLISYEIIKNIGLFDERLKQYGSDDEYCLRAIKKGYRVYISWDAKVFSYFKKTSKDTIYLKPNFVSFFKSFFVKTSRNYIGRIFIIYFKYGNKLLFPITILVYLIANIRAFLKYQTKGE